MKVKTSETSGDVLEWLVSKCLGVDVSDPEWALTDDERFTTNWSQGGPIIEREKIRVSPNMGGAWSAQIRHETTHPLVAHKVLAGWTNKSGPTPLIAAMRCYVASKLGEEVEVPDNLGAKI